MKATIVLGLTVSGLLLSVGQGAAQELSSAKLVWQLLSSETKGETTTFMLGCSPIFDDAGGFEGQPYVCFLSVRAIQARAIKAALEKQFARDHTEDKLDRILGKLQELDDRMKKLEEKQAATPEAPKVSSSARERVLDRLQQVFRLHIFNVYSNDPNRRVQELLNNSEDLRQIQYEWERIWFEDKPKDQPERTPGGIQ